MTDDAIHRTEDVDFDLRLKELEALVTKLLIVCENQEVTIQQLIKSRFPEYEVTFEGHVESLSMMIEQQNREIDDLRRKVAESGK